MTCVFFERLPAFKCVGGEEFVACVEVRRSGMLSRGSAAVQLYVKSACAAGNGGARAEVAVPGCAGAPSNRVQWRSLLPNVVKPPPLQLAPTPEELKLAETLQSLPHSRPHFRYHSRQGPDRKKRSNGESV